MRTSSTFSIFFWIHADRVNKNNEAIIYSRITVNGKKVILSLKQRVNVALWDANRQKAKGNGNAAKRLNYFLDEVKSDLVQCYRDLKAESKVITPKLIKARYLGEDKKNYALTDIFRYHNDKKGSKLATKTLCHYRTSQKYILSYVLEEYGKNDIYLQDLDYAFVIGFESFLRSYQPQHYQGRIGNNAVMKHIQRLRRMVTLAYHIEWIERDPFVKFKPRLEKKEREFLTKEELKKIEKLETSIERLTAVRDLFVFSCYTGIPYGDIIELTNKNIVLGIDGDPWLIG